MTRAAARKDKSAAMFIMVVIGITMFTSCYPALALPKPNIASVVLLSKSPDGRLSVGVRPAQPPRWRRPLTGGRLWLLQLPVDSNPVIRQADNNNSPRKRICAECTPRRSVIFSGGDERKSFSFSSPPARAEQGANSKPSGRHSVEQPEGSG